MVKHSQGRDLSGVPVQPAQQNTTTPEPDATVQKRQGRRTLSNAQLLALTVAVPVCLLVYFVALSSLPQALNAPGSPIIYLAGVVGSLLLLMAGAFVVAKRAGRGGSPMSWFIAHVGCGFFGFALVAVHSTGKLDQLPALLLLNLLALMALGVWARVVASRSIADTFGTKLRGFAKPDTEMRDRLASIIKQKSTLLERLDPKAYEATFSVTLGHLVRKPISAIKYLRLANTESQLMGQRSSVGPGQAWWRPLHLVLAATFFAGLVIHIVMVTFFAGYVAEGRPISWWHVTAWTF